MLKGFLPDHAIVMARSRSAAPAVAPTPLTGDSLEQIRADLDGCTRCKLCTGRKTIVLGEGNPKAELVFVGEGPGEQEDIQGRPFVGKAGQLLDKMIEAMGLSREQVFIANVVKCRPPGNRNPEPDEIASCSPFLHRQLDLIRPKVIVALGKFAAQTLLQTEQRISELRGNFFEYRGVRLMPTFHPAFLLRNPESKREAWSDLQKVAVELGIEIPKRR
jgi:uracil-DNA glycosylase family 4